MKKKLLYGIILSVLLFSCKKDHNSGTAKKTYSVKFNVSDFIQTIGNAPSKKEVNKIKTNATTIPISNYLTQLYYYVFDSNGEIIHSLTQDSSTTNFGNIADNLPEGTYTIVIAAGKSGLSFQTNPPLLSQTKLSYPGPWKDTFLKKFQITVSDGGVNQVVKLDRIVGQLEVNILDALPATAKSISIKISPESSGYSVGTSTPYTSGVDVTTTTDIPASAAGTTNYKTYCIVANTITPFTVSITCYDASKKVLGSAEVTNVTCQPNTKTILSGNLAGGNVVFKISLNSAWDPTTIQIPF